MSSVESTPALKERERVLQEDVMPSILGMRRFLGKLNYGDQFFHRQLKGQLSWDFVDRETHTTFKPILLGEIATPAYGTLLKGKGNYKPPRDQPTAPLQDGNKAKNIIVLQKMAGSDPMAERAFINQTAPLNKIKQEVEAEDRLMKKSPINAGQSAWVDSSAEVNELPSKRPLDLIVISLPKKFNTPPHANVITEVQPLTDDKALTHTKGKKREHDHKVEIGAYYEPSLLPDFSTETFHLVKDKLVQYDFRDIDDELIPAWQVEKALRPGTIILVSAVLHVYNIKIENSTNFRRFYQITAERIRVLAEAFGDDPLPDEEPQYTTKPESSETQLVDEFALYKIKKRAAPADTDDHHASKKRAITTLSTDDNTMDAE